MARGATILRVSLEIALVERDVYETLSFVVAQHPSETRERAVVRILARGLWHGPGFAFGRGVSTADEPDLWQHAEDGRLLHWIEVGQPDGRRLVKAARRAARASVLAFGAGAERWRQQQLDGLDAPTNLDVLRVPDAFVEDVAEGDARQIALSLTWSGGTLYASRTDDGAHWSCEPEIWLGAPFAAPS